MDLSWCFLVFNQKKKNGLFKLEYVVFSPFFLKDRGKIKILIN